MKKLLLQLTILLLSVGFLWHFGLIKTTSDNEDMNLFLDLTQAVNQLKLQLSKDFSPNLRWVGSVRLSSHCIVENFIVKTITCLLAKVLFQQTFLPLIPTCKRWQLWARKTQFLISISLPVFGWDIFMLRHFRPSNGRSMKYSGHECDDYKSLNEQ